MVGGCRVCAIGYRTVVCGTAAALGGCAGRLVRLARVAFMVKARCLISRGREYGALAVFVVGHYRDAGGLGNLGRC